MSLIKLSAGNDQYWLLNDVPHQRGQFDVSAKIGEEVVEIYSLNTLKSLARGKFDEFSPDGTTPYASTQALIDDLKTFFFRSLTGGGGGAVDSVNGQTGVVILDKTDIGLGNVDNLQQIPLTEKGANDGVATLDSSGKIPSSQLPNGLEGGITVIGFWNASTNTPNLSSITASQGEAYQVSVAGTTSLNGENNWDVRDLVVWSDSLTGNWFKIDSTDSVLSVNGQTGAVVLDADDISDTGTSNKFASQTQLDQIATNTSNISSNTTNISSNTTNINSNTTNISSNTSNISSNTTNISNNTTNISNNTSSISSNTTNISNNTSSINLLNGSASVTSTATLTPDIDSNSLEQITAQSSGLTVAAPTGTPFLGQRLVINITDNGTARAITWNAVYNVVGVTLPVTTTISKSLYIGCIYNSNTSNWDVVAVKEEA